MIPAGLRAGKIPDSCGRVARLVRRETVLFQKLITLAVLVVVFVGAASFFQNGWEKAAVGKAMDDILLPSNAHTFGDRVGLERRLAEAVIHVVGEDSFFGPGLTYKRPLPEQALRDTVFIYHYKPTIPLSWLGDKALPISGGVQVIGTDVHVSALVANIWWTQKRLFLFEEDVWATRSSLVSPADVAGSGYRITAQPWPDGDAQKYEDEPWTVIESFR